MLPLTVDGPGTPDVVDWRADNPPVAEGSDRCDPAALDVAALPVFVRLD
ncbi:MAG TPA: hypothetical protein VFP68_07175 [Burkholderiaceae bacterium]|nr:hypothetical protein [Burkholderiaceae bacterium]